MTRRERALAALRCRVPDRIPIFELLVDSALLKAATPQGDYVAFAKEFDFDLVLTGTPSDLYDKRWIDESKGLYENEWGMKRQYTEQTVSVPLEGPIKEPSDLDTYEPPDPLAPRRFESLQRLLDEFGGERAVGMHLHDSFNYCYYLRGMEEMMMDIILNPELVRGLVRLSVEHNIAMARRAIELGADFIVLGDDYGSSTGPLVSPQHFAEFFIPGLGEVVAAIHDAGGIAIKHCCGDINALLDMMVLEAGIDALHPLDKTVNMDMVEVKQKFPGRLCVMGGVDCGAALCDDPPERLEDIVRELRATVGERGGFVIASSNSLHKGVRLENYRAMVDAVKRVGTY